MDGKGLREKDRVGGRLSGFIFIFMGSVLRDERMDWLFTTSEVLQTCGLWRASLN